MNQRTMKILFIGGTGNLSAECASLLHTRGHEISVLTRGKNPVPSSYRILCADRKDPAAVRNALRHSQHDVVLQFIGYDLPDVQLDYRLFRSSIQQYIFISSTTVYAKPHTRLPLTEDAPLGNVYWEYAQKKQRCEEWLLSRWRNSHFPVTIIRPSHTYSKRWIPNPVSSASYSFAARLENRRPVFVPDNGDNPWTLTAASDFAVGVAGLVGHQSALGEVFHITSDDPLTWNQIYAEISSALHVSQPEILKIPTGFICATVPRMTGPLKGDKSNPGIFDNSKIKRFVPEFACRKSFHAGIRESVTWLKKHPVHQVMNPDVDAVFDQVISAWRSSASA